MGGGSSLGGGGVWRMGGGGGGARGAAAFAEGAPGQQGGISFRSEFAVFPSLFGLQFQSLGSANDCLTSHETEEQSLFLRSVVTVLLLFLGAWIALI